jgi:hypothetical protein
MMIDAGLANIIDPELIAAGFLGGLVHAVRVKKATPWEVVGFIVVGGLAANFIAPQVLRILTLVPPAFVAFGVGMSGKRLCYYLEKFVDKLNIFGKPSNE